MPFWRNQSVVKLHNFGHAPANIVQAYVTSMTSNGQSVRRGLTLPYEFCLLLVLDSDAGRLYSTRG